MGDDVPILWSKGLMLEIGFVFVEVLQCDKTVFYKRIWPTYIVNIVTSSYPESDVLTGD